MELITERRRVNGPYVYGYLRHTMGSSARHTALTESLAEYCQQHELTLCGLFTEREATADVHSPAFVGLLDALALPDVYGVVLPARSHFGPKNLAAERERQLAGVSARLIVVRCATPRRSRERPIETGSIVRQRGGA
ncbi:hypothetical protein HRW16_09715 [Streptomyces lunaelactis]|uniref:hypothetical protein n=1 Tax=Streptomyces lunaelactis TaxID=1535768 RepID=UPI001585C380|nr:hypothetical protein [Streptomyces lunaelactis]NUK35063.1 hypothetical protein [Streptomyces lunaelactis]NUK44664.1 hypothetical protein [Streptomyces lunaelactis]NUK92130.1 hypothetical protein [Streptomyces lunaelactis]NUL29893.1 hypothetical protein [Streptomyces lunaelactis]